MQFINLTQQLGLYIFDPKLAFLECTQESIRFRIQFRLHQYTYSAPHINVLVL